MAITHSSTGSCSLLVGFQARPMFLHRLGHFHVVILLVDLARWPRIGRNFTARRQC
ncbi:MAG TPA: hypothetical protein VI094_14840 [Propionibacteriaceae bacterium]